MAESIVYNMDCIEYMKTVPDKFFDLLIADPPYGIGADKFTNGHDDSSARQVRKNRLNSGGGALKNRVLNKSDCSWDSAPPSKEYFDEMFRVSKNQIIWGGNYFDLPPTRGIAVWDKKQPWENFSQVELAWTSFDTPAALFSMVNTIPGKIHPTQKPVRLYKWILGRYAKQGDKIFDPYLGSGSSRIAAWDMGFDFVGVELDQYYFEQSEKRFQEHTRQLRLNL